MINKIKKQELDVDFIGEQNRPLTQEEQLVISAFIQKLKASRKLVNKGRICRGEKQLV
jgi:hypothetical protein